MRSILPRYKWIFFTVVFFIIVIPIAGFLLSKNNLGKPINNVTPTQKPVDPCAQFQFPTDPKEINCEEAKTIAVNKYPGQVLNIEKTTFTYQVERRQNGKREDRKVWIVYIKPYDISLLPSIPNPDSKKIQTATSIGVAVDRDTKEILFLKTSFNK